MSLKKKREGEKEIVVRRRSKKGHGEAHSGAWKVAFADFTLAMMALFMVLWIINPSKSSAPITAEDPVSNPLMEGMINIFDGFDAPVELEARPSQPEPQPEPKKADEATEEPIPSKIYRTRQELEQLAELIDVLSGKLDALTNLEVAVVPQGLRILIKDDEQRYMFERGSAKLNPHFKTLLGNLAEVLSKVENRIIISGHTDATQYRRSALYNNWNLSGDRALVARNVMVQAGLPGERILQVTALADVMPLNPLEPTDGINRRIELLLLTERAEVLYRELFGESYPQARLNRQLTPSGT